MKDYKTMLTELYENLPKKVVGKERFEVPSFNSFIHGKQTIIKNFTTVASQLRRKPQHLLKFLSKEFAVPANIDGKRSLLQGKFRDKQLNARLTNYVDEYVLCNECNKPDTEIITFENHKYKRCEVCGARSPVKSL